MWLTDSASHLICLFLLIFFFFFENQPDSVLLLNFSVAVDDNHFISYPSTLCNTPTDGPLTPTSDFFLTPNPDPICDDPFTVFSDQSNSLFSFDKDSGLSSFILNGPESIFANDCTSDTKHINGLCDAQLTRITLSAQEHKTNPNFNLNPFCSTSLNNPTILNGLYKSGPSVLYSPFLCNGESEAIPLFKTSPISKDAQNGGLMILCPPPQSLKCGSIQRREKVNILKWKHPSNTAKPNVKGDYKDCPAHQKWIKPELDHSSGFVYLNSIIKKTFKVNLVLQCEAVSGILIV